MQIELGDNCLILVIPSDECDAVHRVRVPLNEAGVKTIYSVLLSRSRQSDRRIGTDSAPTQSMVDAWLAANRVTRSAKTVLHGIDINSIHIEL